jgi:tetratricopeptide (TPR) repeat protein
LLTQAEPENNAVEDKVTLREVLDRAAAKVGDRFAGQPEIEETLRFTISKTYHGLGSWEQAERQFRAVFESTRQRLGPDSKETLMAQSQLGHLLRHVGRAAEGLALEESAVAALEKILGPDDENLIGRQQTLAVAYFDAGKLDRSIPMFEEIVRRRTAKLGADDPSTVHERAELGSNYLKAGQTT